MGKIILRVCLIIILGLIIILMFSSFILKNKLVLESDINFDTEVIELKFVESDRDKFTVIEKNQTGTVIDNVVMDSGHIYRNTWCGDKNYSYMDGKVLVYDRITKKIYVEVGVVTEGSVDSITCSDDLKPIYNINLGSSKPGEYDSYLIYDGVRFDNDGGIIVGAIKNGNYLYSIEKDIESLKMKLVISDLQGNKVLIDESDNVKGFGLNIIVFIDENDNVVFNTENNLLIIDKNNNIVTKKLPVILAEHNQVVEHNEQIYLYSKRGVFYKLTRDYEVIELANMNIENIDDAGNPYYFKDGSEEYILINFIIPNDAYHDAILYKFDFKTSKISELYRYDMHDHEAVMNGFSDIYIDAKFE